MANKLMQAIFNSLKQTPKTEVVTESKNDSLSRANTGPSGTERISEASHKLANDVSPTFASAISDDILDDSIGDEETTDVEFDHLNRSISSKQSSMPKYDNQKKKEKRAFDLNSDPCLTNDLEEQERCDVTQDVIKRKHRQTIQLKEMSVKIIKTLGDGMSSVVYEVEDAHTGEHYAMKRMHRQNKLVEWLFITECSFLKSVRCSGIIEMVNFYADHKYFYILTELGIIDLFTCLKNEKCLSENVTRNIILRLLKTLTLLHRHNFVHRDIKPENIVFTQRGTLKQPKLIDFGDSIAVDDNKLYNELVGTRCYLSPERWRLHYGYELKASDVWAVGVLAYEMVTGKRCFFAPNDQMLIEKIQQGKWQFPPETSMSLLCVDFIQRLLHLNPKRRPTAEHAMKHPFFTCAQSDNSMEALMEQREALRVWCDELSVPCSTYASLRSRNAKTLAKTSTESSDIWSALAK